MATKTQSPIDFLLVHQLKRENAFLQQQIQRLQANQEKQDNLNAKHDIAIRKTNDDLRQLQQDSRIRMQDIDQQLTLTSATVDRHKQEIAHQKTLFDDLQQAVEDRLQNAVRDEGGRTQRSDPRHEVVIQKIDQLKGVLREHAVKLKQTGSRPNASQSKEIFDRLDNLRAEVSEKREKTPRLEDSITALDAAKHVVEQKNMQLGQKHAGARLRDSTSSGKKSHHWGGGGADKDIIAPEIDVNAKRATRSTTHADKIASKQKDLAIRTSAVKRKQSPVNVAQPQRKKQAKSMAKSIPPNYVSEPIVRPNTEAQAAIPAMAGAHQSKTRKKDMRSAAIPQQAIKVEPPDSDSDVDHLDQSTLSLQEVSQPSGQGPSLMSKRSGKSKAVPDNHDGNPFVLKRPPHGNQVDRVNWSVPPDEDHLARSVERVSAPRRMLQAPIKEEIRREFTTRILPPNFRPNKPIHGQ